MCVLTHFSMNPENEDSKTSFDAVNGSFRIIIPFCQVLRAKLRKLAVYLMHPFAHSSSWTVSCLTCWAARIILRASSLMLGLSGGGGCTRVVTSVPLNPKTIGQPRSSSGTARSEFIGQYVPEDPSMSLSPVVSVLPSWLAYWGFWRFCMMWSTSELQRKSGAASSARKRS